jgi:hypothetical protein
MARNHTFPLVMSPGQRLAVIAPDAGVAIAVAREALTYLQGSNCDAAMATAHAFVKQQADEAGGYPYVLTCLLCGLVHPQCPGKSDLVAMQEHHMEVHGFKAGDFELALRVNRFDDSAHYIWALAPALANLLGLPQLCYLRAVKLPSASVQPEIGPKVMDGPYTTLVYTSPFDGSSTLQAVLVAKQDTYAWYGWPRGQEEGQGDLLVWPKGEWKLAET